MSENTENETKTPLIDVLSEWLLYASAGLIITGLILPSIYKPGLFGGNDYNLVGVISALLEAEQLWLAAIVFVFSVLFPLAKNVLAAVIFRLGASPRPRLIAILQILGKWSMLDVFLAAILVGLTQVAAFMNVEPRPGLYFFAAGVLLNNLATTRLAWSRRLKAPDAN